MGTHRKPRTGVLDSPAARRGAIGVGAAALASASLLSQPASADDADPPSVEEQRDRADDARGRALEVREQVDALYRDAGAATQRYNEAQEAVERQERSVDDLLGEAADATDRVNEARRTLGAYAAAQYRYGTGLSDTAHLLLSDDPQSFFSNRHTLNRLGEVQQQALTDFTSEQRAAEDRRAEAADALAGLEASQVDAQARKEEVQGRLAEAQALLNELSAEEEAQLAELERLEREEAERQAAAAAAEAAEREEAAREAAAREAAEQEQADAPADTPPPATDDGGSDSDTSSRAEQAIAFAETQLGKPYVMGGTGPNSWDCSGLTQAAWRAAGVELPRVTWDQVNAGTSVPRDQLRPGDLVFFYADISHVGLYIGDGMMIHAPKPGAYVRYESIDYMPFHSARRPG
ncbi:C40 family peptidase [Streptomyces avicenniae]|uniref:C40 family peptidase n=1 Tax=Streptomyces avicenniae TaxID=500153 RepID=UPI00069B8B4E|nr:C40 family peptidase [Streptomyces avicenniae]